MAESAKNIIKWFCVAVMFLDVCMYLYMRTRFMELTWPQFLIQHWKFTTLYIVIAWYAAGLVWHVHEKR